MSARGPRAAHKRRLGGTLSARQLALLGLLVSATGETWTVYEARTRAEYRCLEGARMALERLVREGLADEYYLGDAGPYYRGTTAGARLLAERGVAS